MAIVIQQQGGLLVSSGVYKATIFTWSNGQYMLMDQHFFIPPAGFLTGPTLGELASTVQTAIDASLQACCTVDTDLLGCKVNQIQPHVAGAIPLSGIATSTSDGSLTAPGVPLQSALVVTKLSLKQGRSGRGRIYMPAPGYGALTGAGDPAAGYLAAVATFYGNLFGISAITCVAGTANAVAVIYNKKTGGFTTQVSYRVNHKFGTQRRRSQYGKTNPPTIV